MALQLQKLLQQNGFTAEVCDFVIASNQATHANHGVGNLNKGPFARDVCAAVRDLAFFRYRDRAASILKGWGLTNSACVGQIIDMLLQVGFFTFKVETKWNMESFNDLFTVGDAAWNAALYEPDPRRGLCGKCRYDLRGTPSRVCPECGSPN